MRILYISLLSVFLPLFAFAQTPAAWGFLNERHLLTRVELGLQDKSFYTSAGLQMFLPSGESPFLGHGPYAGAQAVFGKDKTAINPQIGYHAAFYAFIYTGVDFTMQTSLAKTPIIAQPKIGISIFTLLNIFYSRSIPLSKNASGFNQWGLSFGLPLKRDY